MAISIPYSTRRVIRLTVISKRIFKELSDLGLVCETCIHFELIVLDTRLQYYVNAYGTMSVPTYILICLSFVEDDYLQLFIYHICRVNLSLSLYALLNTLEADLSLPTLPSLLYVFYSGGGLLYISAVLCFFYKRSVPHFLHLRIVVLLMIFLVLLLHHPFRSEIEEEILGMPL